MSNLAYKVQQQKQYTETQQPSPQKLFTRKVTKGEKVLWTFALLALLAASVYLVSTYATIYSVNRDVQQLETKIDSQTKVNSELQQQVSNLSRPERIFSIAKDKLGLTMNNSNVKVLEK